MSIQRGDFEIRPLSTLEDIAAVERIQRMVWGDPSVIIYQHMLISFVRNGALLLGAIKDGEVIGFLLGYLGTENPDSHRPAMANLKMVSQRMAVDPQYRDSGIGYELKVAQRDFAIKQGIRLVTWTFDPLLSRNAHLNIRKLGAIIREYKQDFYGTNPSPLVRAGSSDRVIAEWWVTNNRVEQRLSGKRGGLSLAHYTDANATILNPTQVGSDGLLYPADHIIEPRSAVILVEIPDDYDEMTRKAPDLARTWREYSRDSLSGALKMGFAVTDFVRGSHGDRMRSFYALSVGEALMASGGFSVN